MAVSNNTPVTSASNWALELMQGEIPMFNQDTFRSLATYAGHDTASAINIDSGYASLERLIESVRSAEQIDLSNLGTMKSSIQKFNKSSTKTLSDSLKGAYKEMHTAVVAHQKAAKALTSYDMNAIQKEVTRQLDDAIKAIEQEFGNGPVAAKDIIGGRINIPAGTERAELQKALTELRSDAAQSIVQFQTAINERISHHNEKIGEIKNYARQLEQESGVTVEKLLGKELGGVFKAETNSITHTGNVGTQAPDHVSSSVDHAPKRFTARGAIVGGLAGGAAGYLMGGDDSKGTTTTVGAIGGAIGGGFIDAAMFQKAESALGAVAHNNSITKAIGSAVAHIR